MNQWVVSGQPTLQGRQILTDIQHLLNSPASFLNAGLQMLYRELESLLIRYITFQESLPVTLAQLSNAHRVRNFEQAALRAEELANLYSALGESNLEAYYDELITIYQRMHQQLNRPLSEISIGEVRNLVQLWTRQGDRALVFYLRDILTAVYSLHERSGVSITMPLARGSLL
jgi:hypothetical protein